MTAPATTTHRMVGAVGSMTPVALAWLVAVALLARHEVPVRESLAYSAYALFVIALPGRLVWDWLWEARPGGSGEVAAGPGNRLEAWACGAAVGYVLELAAYPVARLAGHPRWYVLLPGLVVVTLGIRAWRRRSSGSTPRLGAGSRWGLAAVVAYLTTWLSVIVFARYRLTPYRLLDEDETFHLALVGELRHHFPPQYPYVEAGDLTYQWFVHAHMAASTWATGIEPLTAYRRFDVLVLSVVAVLGTAAVASRITRRSWPGLVAAGALVLVGSFDVTGMLRGESITEDRFLEGGLLINSPTQTLGFALAPAVMILLLRLIGSERMALRVWVALAVGAGALSGVKVTFLPLFVCGLLAAGAVGLWRREPRAGRPLVAAVVCVVGVLGSGTLLYRGDSQSLTWGPGRTGEWYLSVLGLGGSGATANVILTVALLLGWLTGAAGAVGLLTARSTRWDPRAWFLLGAVSAGLGATFLLFHGGMSQLYFGRSTAQSMAVACAWGLSVLHPVPTSARRASASVAAAVSGGLLLLLARTITQSMHERAVERGTAPALPFWVNAFALVAIVLGLVLAALLVRDVSRRRLRVPLGVSLAFLVGLGLARSMAFGVGSYPAYDAVENRKPIGAGALAATRWLRENSEPDERVLTNAHCVADPPGEDDCDTRHFWMSAFTERRFLLEGWAYTRFQEGWVSPYWGDADLLARNDELFSDPSELPLERFLAEHPAQWLLADRALDVDMTALKRTSGLALRFEQGRYAVFEVVSSRTG